MPTPLLAYGSLMLPTSLVARFSEIDPPVGDLYDRGVRAGDDDLLRAEALGRWDEVRGRITLLPVRVRGFRRYYGLESPRGGAMLTVVDASAADRINGVVVTGLRDEERAAIDADETGYEPRTVEGGIEPYPDDDALDALGASVPERVDIYAKPADATVATTRTRNETYHARVLAGIEMLAGTYGPPVADAVRREFRETTDEHERGSDDPEAFVTVAENDRR